MARTLRWTAAVLALALLAAACGDDDDDSAGTGTTAAAATDTTTATTAGGGASATTAAAGATTAPSVATSGAKTVLGSGIPSGDACPKTALTGVPGVTDTEIAVGGIVAVTDPTGSPYEDSVKGLLSYFKGVNDAGGVCGRQLKYVETIDDQAASSRNLLGARKLVEDDGVFAIAPIMTQSFGSADYLVKEGVPTFGWNIQVEWSKGPNLFAQAGSYQCFQPVTKPTCPTGLWPYIAKDLVKVTKVAGMSYGSSPQSASCGDARKVSFDTFGPALGVQDVFEDQSLSFGFSPEALGPTIDRIKSEGVELVVTCMDLGANIRILQAMQDAGLSTGMYWPNGYDQKAIDEFGPQIKNPVYTGFEVRPFEVKQSPGMEAYQNSMKANGIPLSEYTLTGWINADLLTTGIRAAAQTTGKFDRKTVVDAINALPSYSAGGIVPTIVWANDHSNGPSSACTAFLRVDGAAKKYVSDTPDTPWTCLDPKTLDPSSAKLQTFGDEDTGLSTEAVKGTESAAQTGGAAEQPADAAKATADIQALVVNYLATQTADDRLKLVANGDSIRDPVTKTFRSGLQLEPLNIKVTFTGKTTADIAFGIKLNGTELQGITSTAYVVDVNGTWLYHPFAVCDGITQAGDAATGAACLAAAKAP
jgi:ABC-type branched-subunit amino acid transport system substrate-binding protein